MPPLLTATHLAQWADQHRAQGMLPLLLRRLIVAAVNPIRIDFPAGDSVNRPGYDGFLQTITGNAFVPQGQSVWELGTGRSPAEKAEDDYVARTANPGQVTPADTTFVFVTPRRWQGKTAWAHQKQAEHDWAEVRAYDAEELEQWLDQTPPVAAWARRQIAGAPEGVHDLEEIWELWSLRTNLRLTAGLFLAGREEAAECIRGWLIKSPSCLRVRSATADEAVGFVAAVIETLAEPERERVQSRAIMVSTPDAWRMVTGQRTPAVVLASSPTLGSDAQAVACGHHVLLTYGNDAGGVSVDIELPHLRRRPLEEALRQMGLSDERSRSLAGESRGRVAALVDLLGGGSAPPHWAAPAVASELVPFVLAGSWTESEADSEAMRRLARLDGGQLSLRLSRWVNETDPPIRLVGGVWEWISRQRAWPHLSRHITTADLTAFRQVVTDVLADRDPRFGLPAAERWMAGIHNLAHRYSEPLRRGLAEGLALIATRPNPLPGHDNPVGLVRSIVRAVLGVAPDGGRWYALAPVLRPLAEAAPDEFLAAVDRDVLGSAEVRAALFQEEGMFGGSRHTELLWALETLAWWPELLSLVAVALAGLATHDPGRRLHNRPTESLRAIFLSWRPHTGATVGQRLAALDAVHRRYPAVAFDLCLLLMPRPLDNVMPTPRPRWRDCHADPERAVTLGEYWEAVEGAFDRAIAWAGDDPSQWQRLVSPIPGVSPERVAALLTRLEALPLEGLADGAGAELRRAIRHLLHQRRTITGIYPHLAQEHIGRLDVIYRRLQPHDLVQRHAWLFDNQPDVLTVDGQCWEREQASVAEGRTAAIQELVETDGVRDLVRLAAAAEVPFAVGVHAAQSSLSDQDIFELIRACQAGGPSSLGLMHGIVTARFHRDGWAWVERVFSNEGTRNWPAIDKGRFALALPFDSATWAWVEGLGEDVAAEYWRAVNPIGLADVARDAPRAIRTLLDRHRPFAALDLTEFCLHKHRTSLSADLLLSVLRAVTAAATGDQETADTPSGGGNVSWHIGQLLTAVEEAGAADEEQLAQIEWIWLPVLDHTEYGIRTLDRLLSHDPSFFAEVVRLVYRPRDLSGGVETGVPPPDEVARRRAEMAWRLLHEWRGIPGRNDAGDIDAAALRGWVLGARTALRASGHAEVGDTCIGEVLARAPAGADGVWPHEAVRTVLEELDANRIDEGVYLGRVNGRGITCRSPDAGGDQERSLADGYDASASAVELRWPRTARMLRALASSYRHEARREDVERDLNEFWH